MKNYEITKPAKHGFVIDLQDGERRVQVRVFEFEAQRVPGQTGTCEMPVTIDEAAAVVRLREAMEGLREGMYGAGKMMEGKMISERDQEVVPHHSTLHDFTKSGGTRKVLFFDIDGVLNRTPVEMGSLMPDKVSMLDDIVTQTGCVVVVTSSWRRSPEKMKQVAEMMLRLRGGEGVVWSETPILHAMPDGAISGDERRGDEIRAWMEVNGEPDRFVVLDDDRVLGFAPEHVRTDSAVGLTWALTWMEVIERLNGGTESPAPCLQVSQSQGLPVSQEGGGL